MNGSSQGEASYLVCESMRSVILLACLLALVPCPLQAQAGDGRIYVRRIEFLGTDRINDDVLRRELSQLEGTHINTAALEQSRLRLERLPYVERAQIAQRPVKGVPDQVDVLITITDAPARQYGVGGATRLRQYNASRCRGHNSLEISDSIFCINRVYAHPHVLLTCQIFASDFTCRGPGIS